MRKWIIGMALLLIAPAVGAAATIADAPVVTEQLVEGHTVFSIIEYVDDQRDPNATTEEFATAVAVLAREKTITSPGASSLRFPGVLWFNDQYLVNPRAGSGGGGGDGESIRYPCTGSVVAVQSGGADPRPALAASVAGTGTVTYVESYLITDPNDHVWIVDLYDTTGAGAYVWATAILGNELTRDVPDDGSSNCFAFRDMGTISSLPDPEIWNGTRYKDPGDNGHFYPSNDVTDSPNLLYNALLYFRWAHLTADASTVKDHSLASTNTSLDSSGCQVGSEWECPGGDDSREGNSHPYNPDNLLSQTNAAGAGNHGGSADCTGDGIGDLDCHATANVDLYFGVSPKLPARSFKVMDLTGSVAPYHAH